MLDEPLGYGKYSKMSLMDLAYSHPDYIEWMKKQDNIWFSSALEEFLEAITSGSYLDIWDDNGYDPYMNPRYKLLEQCEKLDDDYYPGYEAEKRKRATRKASLKM